PTWVAVSLLLPAAAPPRSAPVDTSPASLRQAVEKALPLLVKAAQGHTARRTCFACHNQAVPMLAVTPAGVRAFKVPAGFAAKQADFIGAFLAGNRANYRLGKGQGGQADTAGQALFTLELAGHQADATTEAVVEYLLKYNSDLDHWRTRSYR